ncbi:hypothetical protein [Salibaculum halophilum]|uniref:hypothetical protein n=1 Tax=Salibaculum halophilum TaxID=1914408 RepID=UPI001179A290|nr:hypothetical protein [Salibaculum halophilum]
MIRMTIVEHVGLPATLTESSSPIWQDVHGRQFRVASGLTDEAPDLAWTPEDGAMPRLGTAAAVIISGMDGLAALNALGLSRLAIDPDM